MALFTIASTRDGSLTRAYNDVFGRKALDFGYSVSFKRLDKGCFEIIGPHGIVSSISQVTRQSRVLQSGMVYHYAYTMLIGLVFFITVIGIQTEKNLAEHVSQYVLVLVLFVCLFIDTVSRKRVT